MFCSGFAIYLHVPPGKRTSRKQQENHNNRLENTIIFNPYKGDVSSFRDTLKGGGCPVSHSGLVTLPEISDPSKDHMNVTVMIPLISEVDLGKQRWEFGGLIDLSIFLLGSLKFSLDHSGQME